MLGQFEIQGLDESLTFSVLIAKEKFRATLKRIDPLKGELKATLKPWRTDVADNQKMLGTIVDIEGKPIAGAVVWVSGATQNGKRWWGQVKGVDRASVSDQDGNFLLTSEVPFEKWELTARANGYCQNKTEQQSLGSDPYKIVLKRGVTVSGTVVDSDGKPVSGHIVGMIQRDRSVQNWIGEHTIATDDKGKFIFTAILPETDWSIYSAIEDRPDVEFFQSELFDSGSNDETQELGKFILKGHGELKGKLGLPAGVVPKGLRIVAERKYAWKSQAAEVESDGTFSFPNLPMGEPLVIYVFADGLQLNPAAQMLQRKDDNALGIFLDKKETEIEIPMMQELPPASNRG